jgi:hypothetical protein
MHMLTESIWDVLYELETLLVAAQKLAAIPPTHIDRAPCARIGTANDAVMRVTPTGGKLASLMRRN